MESRQQINSSSSQFMIGLPVLAAGTAGLFFKDEISSLFNKNKQFFNFSFAHSQQSSFNSGAFQKSFTNDFYSKKNFIHQDNIFNKFGANKQFFSAANAAAATSATTSGEPAPKKNLILEKRLFITETTEGNTAMTQTYKEKINQLIQENIREYKISQRYDRLQVLDQNAIQQADVIPEDLKSEIKVPISAGVRQHRAQADFEMMQFQKVKKNLGNKKMYEFSQYLKKHFTLFPRNAKVRERLYSKPLFWEFVDEWLKLQFKNYQKVAITPEFKMKPRVFQPVFFTVDFIFKLTGKKK